MYINDIRHLYIKIDLDKRIKNLDDFYNNDPHV